MRGTRNNKWKTSTLTFIPIIPLGSYTQSRSRHRDKRLHTFAVTQQPGQLGHIFKIYSDTSTVLQAPSFRVRCLIFVQLPDTHTITSNAQGTCASGMVIVIFEILWIDWRVQSFFIGDCAPRANVTPRFKPQRPNLLRKCRGQP